MHELHIILHVIVTVIIIIVYASGVLHSILLNVAHVSLVLPVN